MTRRRSRSAGIAGSSSFLWVGLAIIVTILFVTQVLGPAPHAGMPGLGAGSGEPALQSGGPPQPVETRGQSNKPASISGGGSIQLIK